MPLSMLSPPMLRAAALATLAVGLLAAASPMAVAQDDLAREVELLKRDLSDLQRFIYRGEGQPPARAAPSAAAPAPSSAPGSPATAEPLPTDVAGRLQVKMQRLEREMRDLTGRVEEAEFRARQAEQRLETYAADLEYRLQRLEQSAGLSAGTGDAAAGPGASPGAAPGAPVALGQPADAGQAAPAPDAQAPGTTVISSAGATQDGGAAGAASSEGALGVLRTNAAGEVIGAEIAPRAPAAESPAPAPAASAPQAPPAPGAVGEAATTAAAPTAALPEGTPESQYEYAFSLLRKRDFPAAEAAMRRFVDRHGDHQLAGNAMYWLGETFYARENYRDAAATFLDAYTGYPSNDKASHSLLKLAMSLGALGKKDAACQAFATLSQDGSASQRILATGESEAAKLGCS